jgi:uncharacterized protein YjbI with pentapeptide repeats
MKDNVSISDVLSEIVQDAIDTVNASHKLTFRELCDALELDPKSDFKHCDLSYVDFSHSDLKGFDFTGSDLRRSESTSFLTQRQYFLDVTQRALCFLGGIFQVTR